MRRLPFPRQGRPVADEVLRDEEEARDPVAGLDRDGARILEVAPGIPGAPPVLRGEEPDPGDAGAAAVLDAIVGVPAEIASKAVMPKGSLTEGIT